jgi:hypothetical protein
MMYAGLAWNRSAATDMLGDPESARFSTMILRDVMNLVLFPDRNLIPEDSFKKLLHLMTFDESTLHQYITASHHADISSEEGYIRVDHVKMSDISKAENHLWHMLGLKTEQDVIEAPSRVTTSYCLRLYRKILSESQWRAQDFSAKNTEVYSFMQFMGINNVFAPLNPTSTKMENKKGFQLDSELEELFCCYNVMSLACRALLVSYNTVQKQHKRSSKASEEQMDQRSSLSYQHLLNGLGVGIKSDLANSMLEGLNSFTFIWKRRFCKSLLVKLRDAGLFTRRSSGLQGNEFTESIDAKRVQIDINKRYLLQDQPIIPAFAMFRVLCHDLPLPKSLEDYVERMFS